MTFDLRADENRFAQNTGLNNTSGVGSVIWNWEMRGNLSGELGADYNRSLAGFYNTNVYERDMVEREEYFASARYQLGPHLTATGGFLYQDTTLSAAAAQENDKQYVLFSRDPFDHYVLLISTRSSWPWETIRESNGTLLLIIDGWIMPAGPQRPFRKTRARHAPGLSGAYANPIPRSSALSRLDGSGSITSSPTPLARWASSKWAGYVTRLVRVPGVRQSTTSPRIFRLSTTFREGS